MVDVEQNCTNCKWQKVEIICDNCDSEQLKELALTYFYADSTDGEHFPICGGYWNKDTNAKLFRTRSNISNHVGFRSAYFKKK